MPTTLSDPTIVGNPRPRMQSLAALALCVALGACGSQPKPGVIGSVEGFAGIAVADEPSAVLAARDVLAAGGSAADAAVALYFSLAVAMPSTAALGGGGVCIVHDADKKTTEALDFLPRAAPEGRVALPAAVRGMAALQARYGKLRWEQDLANAETMARFGVPTSEALASELATVVTNLAADPEMARIFFHPDGTPLQKGDPLRQELLAATLAQLRVRGAGDFYNGTLGHALVDGAQALGAPLTIDALRAIKPEFLPAVELPLGDWTLYTSPPPAAGGVVLGELVAMMTEAGDFEGTKPAELPHLIAEATKRAFVDRASWMQSFGDTTADPAELVSEEHAKKLMSSFDPKQATPVEKLGAVERQPENPWATGFVTADKDGNVVACDVTMNALFGAGRMAPGTGILLAPAPNERGAGYRSLGPAIVGSGYNGRIYFAGAASGGETGPSALAQVMLRAVLGGQSLADAEAAPRYHHNGDPDLVFHERDASEAELASLTQRGHALDTLAIIGRVSALWCPNSLQADPKTCQAAADPRGFGLAVVQSE
jgi:gamma-glutamyltranspeptidase / glutathione hydrolase